MEFLSEFKHFQSAKCIQNVVCKTAAMLSLLQCSESWGRWCGRSKHYDVIKWKHSPCYWPFVTVPERKCVTKIRVRYHDPRWRWQQPVRMFTPRFLLFRIVFHVFDAGYRAIVSYCFYVIPESVIEFDKTAVNRCTKNTEDLGNSSMRSW